MVYLRTIHNPTSPSTHSSSSSSSIVIVVTKVFDYTWKRFPDPQNGEWFGYLNRRGTSHASHWRAAWCGKWSQTHAHIRRCGGAGEVLLQLKGGKWKGCFHVPRTLYLCAKIFQKLHDEQQQQQPSV